MFKSFTLRELGGLNENEDPTSLRPNELVEATNTARFGVLTGTRPGMNFDSSGPFDDVIEGTPAVQGVHEWSRNRDGTQEIVAVAGGEIWTGPAVATDQLDKGANSLTITSGATNLWTFADHNDILYAAGGASGDSFWYWDGTNDPDKIDVQDSGATTIKPKYVFHWKNYMFLSGLQGGALPDNNPNVWRYHELGTAPTSAGNWPTANTIGGGGIGGLSGYGSEFSTGTAAFQDNNGSYLLLLTNKKIYSYVQDQNSLVGFVKNDEIANGCVSQQAYVDLGMDSGDAIYMSEVGIHSLRLSQQYSGRARAFLSWPIRKTFANLNRNRFQYVSAGYWPTEGIVAFAVSTSGSSTHDLILAMDIQNAQEITPDTVRWYKWNLASVSGSFTDTVTFLTFGRDSSNAPVMYIGTSAGKVGIFNRDSYLDFTYQFETAFTTKHETFGNPSSRKRVGDMYIVSRGNGDYRPSHTYIFDYGAVSSSSSQSLQYSTTGGVFGTAIFGTSVFGGAQNISTQKFYGIGSGDTIAHRFRHNPGDQVSEPFFIASVSQQVSMAGESEGSVGEEAA